MRKSGIVLVIFFLLFAVASFFGFQYYKKYFAGNVEKEGYVLIPHSANFNSILDSISPYLKNKENFSEVAMSKNLNQFFNAGRYRIKSGMNNRDLVNMIKAGNQTENTFRIGDFFKKFEEDYNGFWTAERKAKEKNSGLTRDQIYALASLVYKETGGKPDEMKTIAGLYLNRYRKGMKLQSDPTVIYAVSKANNFQGETLKRVFYKHLREPSPYNTYFSAGIPPGPICMVDKNSVDAVLNAEKNNFIFMAANPDKFGFHRFTASDVEHAKNAKAYQDWLNSKNIK